MSFSEAIEVYIEKFREGDCENAFHGLLEMTPAILPELETRFRSEWNTEIRHYLLHVIWEYRDQSVVRFLGEALLDSHDVIWQEAMDGLVALASSASIDALQAARSRRLSNQQDFQKFHQWLEEAITQAEESVQNPPVNFVDLQDL